MKKYLSFILLLTLSLVARGQVSKQQASQLVLDSVVGNSFGNVNVYMDPSLQTSSFYVLSSYDSIAVPYSSYWMFFVDDEPNSYWGHGCRYVFIEVSSGDRTTVNYQMPPYGYDDRLDALSIAVTTSDCVSQCATPQQTIIPNADVNGGKYALLIAGNDLMMGGQVSCVFWNAISHTYSALLEHGYKKENIYALAGDGTASSNRMNCLDLDGQGDDDIRNAVCSVSSIRAAVQSIKRSIEPSDVLYIGYVGHGSSYTSDSSSVQFQLWNAEPLYDTTFANMLSGINCAQIICNIQSCYSGGFANAFNNITSTAKKTLLTSTSGYKAYTYVPSFASVTGLDQYCYFSISSMRETYPCASSWIQADSVRHFVHIDTLGVKPEIDFDSLVHGGNQNGYHEFGEILSLVSYYDIHNQCTLSYDCGFNEDLLTLCGIGGDVNACQTVSGNFHIERELNVNADSLTIGGGSNLFLFDASLNINSNGTLHLSDNTSIIAKTGNCRVDVNGLMSLGDNVTFRAEDGATLEIEFNPYTDLNLSNVTFENCTLVLPQKNVTFSDCTFIGTPLAIDIIGSSDNAYMAKVSRCTFRPSDSNLSYAIHVANYAFYNISDCVVERDSADGQFIEGISVNYCGNFSTNRQRKIHSNHISGCSDAGVLMYHSAGSITMNEIDHNRIGVKLLNNSNIHRFSGDCLATADTLTQYIHDNTHYEIYMTDNCIPSEFRYNVIRHNGNSYWIWHDVNVVHVNPSAEGDTDIDFRYNYWGAGITPTTQLYTNSGRNYAVSPTWVMGYCDNDDSDAAALLMMADSLALQGETEAAQQGYQQVVANYSESTVAENALLSLLSVGSSAEDLQDYYATDSVIAANSSLSALASASYNQCDIQLQNYEEAIAWYENVITDTVSSYNDSIFARIDLMELYMQMDDGCKFTYGKLEQLIPATHKRATELEQRWLSKIPYSTCEIFFEEALSDDAYLPVENLEVSFNPDDNTVSLVWDLPAINSPEMRLSWASGNLFDHYSPVPWYRQDVAQRFDTTDIKPFVGWRIKDVSIYGPYDNGGDYSVDTISVSVWWGEKNGDIFETEQVFRSILPDFLPNQLYTVTLDTNLYIRSDKEVWIGCDFRSIGPGTGFPWACDDTPSVPGKSWMERGYAVGFPGTCNDSPSVPGKGWREKGDPLPWFSRDLLNYAVSSTIVNPDGATRTIGSNATAPQITGFRVYRNGTMIIDMPHPIQTFYVDENPDRDYDVEYCVTLMYNDGTESESVCGTIEIQNSDEYQAAHPIIVYPNPTEGVVHIEGVEVYEVRVSDYRGRFLKSFLGSNTIDLSGMTTGVYNLEIISNKDTIVKKIIVK